MIEIFRQLGFRPEACVWELTLRCNLRCLHCGSSAGKARRDELTTDELLATADQLVALGNRRTTLSGGEPLLRREWPDVARRLAGGGVTVNMISNGLAFDDREVERALEVGLANVGFSIDGDEARHNHVRGRPDAFSRVMDAVERCREANLPVSVATHINRSNMGLLDQMAATFRDAGAYAWQVQLGFDHGNLSHHPELLLEPADLRDVVPAIARLKQEYDGLMRIDPADDIGYFTAEEPVLRPGGDDEPEFFIGCPAGLRAIGVEADGNVKGCLSLRSPHFVEGNLRESSLEEIWTREGAFAYTRGFTPEQLGGFCRTCQYNAYCRGGCTWNGYLHGRESGLFDNRYCLYRARSTDRARGCGG